MNECLDKFRMHGTYKNNNISHWVLCGTKGIGVKPIYCMSLTNQWPIITKKVNDQMCTFVEPYTGIQHWLRDPIAVNAIAIVATEVLILS